MAILPLLLLQEDHEIPDSDSSWWHEQIEVQLVGDVESQLLGWICKFFGWIGVDLLEVGWILSKFGNIDEL